MLVPCSVTETTILYPCNKVVISIWEGGGGGEEGGRKGREKREGAGKVACPQAKHLYLYYDCLNGPIRLINSTFT